MNEWVSEELVSVELGDKRLDKRMGRVLHRLGSKPSESIPAACRGFAETIGAYRFFNNKQVTEEKVLAPHVDATLKRMAEHKVVLCIQDTTEVDFTGRKLKGAGALSYEERIGFLNHATVAVTPERLCLGVLDTYIWSREGEEKSKNHKRKQKAIEDKESHRWLKGYTRVCELGAELDETTLVSISDREGDIYECFVEARRTDAGKRADWVIRSCQDRSLTDKKDGDQGACYQKLWDELPKSTSIGQVKFKLAKSKSHKSRTIVQSVHAGTFQLRPPYRRDRKLPEVEINAVLVQEINPPVGEDPVTWLLLTSLPAETFEQASVIVDYYLCRWQIEMFFKVLKSGCKIEDRQFETADRIKPCIALLMIVAWRVMYVTMLGRECPDLPCTVLFEDDEWKSVYTIVKNGPLPDAPPDLGSFVIMVAGLGGYLDRKNDTPPGTKSIWIGLQRTIDFAMAWQAFGPENRNVYKP